MCVHTFKGAVREMTCMSEVVDRRGLATVGRMFGCKRTADVECTIFSVALYASFFNEELRNGIVVYGGLRFLSLATLAVLCGRLNREFAAKRRPQRLEIISAEFGKVLR